MQTWSINYLVPVAPLGFLVHRLVSLLRTLSLGQAHVLDVLGPRAGHAGRL